MRATYLCGGDGAIQQLVTGADDSTQNRVRVVFVGVLGTHVYQLGNGWNTRVAFF